MLTEIQDGTYARAWIEETEKGRPWFDNVRAREQERLLEGVGADLRKKIPFRDPVCIKPRE